jgi:hypothetical protein
MAHIPRAWREQMALLEEIDRRLDDLVALPQLPLPLVLLELVALRELIRPTLVREGRRPPRQP